MSLKKIIEENIDALEQFYLELIYAKCTREEKPQLTKLLQDVGIDVLQHVDVVPSMCFYNRVADCEEGIILPARITAIQPWAFCGSNITNMLTNNVKNIMHGAFQESQLDNIVFTESLEQIQDMAFKGCIYLTEIYLPKSLRSLGTSTFEHCNAIEKVHIASDKLVEFPADCFSGCYSLEKINIPDSIEYIGTDAFHNCGFKTIKIPNNCHLISGCFSNCEELETAHIGSDCVVENGAFRGCNKLKKVYLDCADREEFIKSYFNDEGFDIYLNDGTIVR